MMESVPVGDCAGLGDRDTFPELGTYTHRKAAHHVGKLRPFPDGYDGFLQELGLVSYSSSINSAGVQIIGVRIPYRALMLSIFLLKLPLTIWVQFQDTKKSIPWFEAKAK